MGTPSDLNGLEEILVIVVLQSWFNTIMIYCTYAVKANVKSFVCRSPHGCLSRGT